MAGTHKEILERLVATNYEETVGYGCDEYTQKAVELIKKACGKENARVHFLVGGTQTNSTVIDGLLARHEGVLAAESGHINVHESGAIEACGHKVLTLPQYDGKVRRKMWRNIFQTFMQMIPTYTWWHRVWFTYLFLPNMERFTVKKN